MAYALPHPWSLLLPFQDAARAVNCEEADLVADFSAETLAFFHRTEGGEPEKSPRHQGSDEGEAAILTSGARWNPDTPYGRPAGSLSVLPWLRHNPSQLDVQFGTKVYRLKVQGGSRCADAREELTAQNEAAIRLREAVDTLTGFFDEAFDLTQGKESLPEVREFAGKKFLCLDWNAVWQRWLRILRQDEPRMARIVQIAQQHQAQIRTVCDSPRRMLLRHREMTSVGRVQELDSVCLRDLIRRPGRTVLEKAGGRQEILAIVRRETVDTAENRVIKDFLRLCQRRAQSYMSENSRAAERSRVTDVRDLASDCGRWEMLSPIAGAARLVGAPQANYVLQKDPRYHPLWVQYEKLRREEEMLDRVWPWGRRLWADFIRSVVVAWLCGPEAKTQTGWSLCGNLPAYLRTEHEKGSFVYPLSISSRFKRAESGQQLVVVHSSHAHLCPGLETALPRAGAELSLVLYPDNPQTAAPAAVLNLHTVLSMTSAPVQRASALQSLDRALRRFESECPGVRARGLLLRGETNLNHAPESHLCGHAEQLAAPVNSSDWVKQFPVMLAVALKELGT